MVKSIFYSIIRDPEQRKKLNSLKDQRAIYKLFSDNGYNKGFDDFKVEVNDFLMSDEVRKAFDDGTDLSDEALEVVSGGFGVKQFFLTSISSLMVFCNISSIAPSVYAMYGEQQNINTNTNNNSNGSTDTSLNSDSNENNNGEKNNTNIGNLKYDFLGDLTTKSIILRNNIDNYNNDEDGGKENSIDLLRQGMIFDKNDNNGENNINNETAKQNGNNMIVKQIKNGANHANTLPIVYTDDYFSKPATEYSLPLATASLALELSAFSATHGNAHIEGAAQSGSMGPNQSMIIVEKRNEENPETKSIKKDSNVKDALGQLGFENISTNEKYYNEEAKEDGIGVAVASKHIKVAENGENKDYTLIPIVVRGGGYDAEWAGNFNVGAEGHPKGFDEASTKAKDFADEYIMKLSKEGKINGPVKLWIVGYSRGGATAGLVGYKYTKAVTNNGKYTVPNKNVESKPLEIELTKDNIYTYTFEAPNNFCESNKDDEKAGSFTNIHNIINSKDLVTGVPLKDWGFTRVGQIQELKVERDSKKEWLIDEILSKFDLAKQIRYNGNNAESNWFGAFEDLREYDAAIDKLFKSVNTVIDQMIEKDKTGAYKANTPEGRRKFYREKLQWGLMNFMKLFKGSSDKSEEFVKYVKSWKSVSGGFTYALSAIPSKLVTGTSTGWTTDFVVNKFKEYLGERNSKSHEQDIEDLRNFLRGLGKGVTLSFLAYLGMNIGDIGSLHKPAVPLATLISELESGQNKSPELKKTYQEYEKLLHLTKYRANEETGEKGDFENVTKSMIFRMGYGQNKEGENTDNEVIEKNNIGTIKSVFNNFVNFEGKAREVLRQYLIKPKKKEELTEKEKCKEDFVNQLNAKTVGSVSKYEVGCGNSCFVCEMPFTDLTKSFNEMLEGICSKDSESLTEDFKKKVDNEKKVDDKEGRVKALLEKIKKYRKAYKDVNDEYESKFGKSFNKIKSGVYNWTLGWVSDEYKDNYVKWMEARRQVYKSMNDIFELLSEDLNLGLSREKVNGDRKEDKDEIEGEKQETKDKNEYKMGDTTVIENYF